VSNPLFHGLRYQRELISFLRSTAALLKANYPLPEILSDCAGNSRTNKIQNDLQELSETVKQGYTFSKALDLKPTFVPPIVKSLIRSGEESDSLPQSIQRAADLIERRYATSSELSAALIYPVTVIVVSIAAVVFLAFSIIPQVSHIYKSAGATLPLLTVGIMWTGKIILFGLACFIVVMSIFWRSQLKEVVVAKLFNIFVKIPFWRDAKIALDVSIWTYMAGVLVDNGIVLTDALNTIAQTINNREVQLLMTRVCERLNQGLSPAKSFDIESEIPDLARKLIAAGDRAGDLSGAFMSVSRFYESEHKVLSRKLITVAEPLTILLAGLFVLLVAAGVLIPIADLGGLLQ